MGSSSSKSGKHGHSNEDIVAELESSADCSHFLSLLSEDRRAIRRPLRARNGDTALHILANKGNTELLKEILHKLLVAKEQEKGQPLTQDECQRYLNKVCNVTNDRGRTPLMAAAKSGHNEFVKCLLENQANVWVRDRAGGAFVLHYAAAAGHDAVIRTIMEHALHISAPAGLTGRGLIDMGNANGLTPLHYAVWHKRHRIVSVLTDLGASLYTTSTWMTSGDSVPCAAGSTPLHVAAASGSLRCARALMKAYASMVGARQEAAQATGQTVPEDDMVDPRLIQDRMGNLPFSVALQHNHMRLLPVLHPFTPLAMLFADERPEDRVLGVPRLVELAAMAAQKVLLEQLSCIEAAANQPKQDKGTGLANKPSNTSTDKKESSATATTAPLVRNSVFATAAEAALQAADTKDPDEETTSGGRPAINVNGLSSPFASVAIASPVASMLIPPAVSRLSQQQAVSHSDPGTSSTCNGNHEDSYNQLQTADQAPLNSKKHSGSPITTDDNNQNGDSSAVATGDEGSDAHPNDRRNGHSFNFNHANSVPDLLLRASEDRHVTAGTLPLSQPTNVVSSGRLEGLLEPNHHQSITGGDQGASWVQRRNTWRAKLVRDPSPHASSPGIATPGTDRSVSPAATPPPPNHHHAFIRPASLQQSDSQQSWIARRSAWRETLKRHEVQLLSGLNTPLSTPGITPPHSQSGAPMSGQQSNGAGPSTSRLMPHNGAAANACTSTNVEGGSVDIRHVIEAAGSLESNGHSSLGARARLPPDAALSLRLLGLGGSLRPTPAIRSSAPALEEHGEHEQLQSQVATAIHMLRMIRLTNGVANAMNDLTVNLGSPQERHTAPTDRERVVSSLPSITRQSTSVLAQLAHVHSQMQLLQRSASCRPADGLTVDEEMHDAMHVYSGSTVADGVRQLKIDEDAVHPTQDMCSTERPDCNNEQPTADDTFVLEHTTPSERTTPIDGSAVLARAASGRPSLLRSTSHAQLSSMVQTLMRSVPPSEAADDCCGVCLDVGTFVSLTGCSHRLCVSCAKELIKLHDLKPALCPFCRHMIMGFHSPNK